MLGRNPLKRLSVGRNHFFVVSWIRFPRGLIIFVKRFLLEVFLVVGVWSEGEF